MNITTRSKIAVRHTTNPANLGYAGTPSDWKNGKADVITSPAKALEYARSLKSSLGGAFHAVDYQCGGVSVNADDLQEAVVFAEFRKHN